MTNRRSQAPYRDGGREFCHVSFQGRFGRGAQRIELSRNGEGWNIQTSLKVRRGSTSATPRPRTTPESVGGSSCHDHFHHLLRRPLTFASLPCTRERKGACRTPCPLARACTRQGGEEKGGRGGIKFCANGLLDMPSATGWGVMRSG